MHQLRPSLEQALAHVEPDAVDLDHDQLDALLDKIEQGDVVHVDPLVILGAPATSLDEEVAAASEVTDDLIVPVARTSELGLYGIVTQTCDIVRGLDDEPFLHICPLISVPEEEWEAAREGRYSVRRFSYPGSMEGHDHLVLDVRVIQTIEKTALLEGSVKPVASDMTEPLKRKLATWLGSRFARYAFPDELEQAVLADLRKAIREKFGAQSPRGGVLRASEGIWVAHNASGMVRVLFMLNAGRAHAEPQLQGDEGKIAAGVQVLQKALAKKLNKSDSGYQVQFEVKTPHAVTAYELLYDYVQLDITL